MWKALACDVGQTPMKGEKEMSVKEAGAQRRHWATVADLKCPTSYSRTPNCVQSLTRKRSMASTQMA